VFSRPLFGAGRRCVSSLAWFRIPLFPLLVSGAAAFVFTAFQPAVKMVAAQQETPKVAPRLQAWLDRKAEGLAYAKKERAAALAEKQAAEKFDMRIVSTAADAAMARAGYDDVERERAAGAKERAQREARKRSRQLEQTKAQTPYGAAPESRWSSNPARLHGPE
jgi:type IV secretory pathway TrbL component